MHWCTHFVILFLFVNGKVEGQECKPELQLQNVEVNENVNTDIRCNIEGMTACNSVTSMIFEKYSHGSKSWRQPVQIDSSDNTNYSTIDDTYTLDGRSTGQKLSVLNLYVLTITSTIIGDGGEWQCRAVVSPSITYTGNILEMLVETTVLESDLKIIRQSPENFVLGIDATYKCELAEIYPEVDIVWTLAGVKYTNGTKQNAMRNFVWDIKNTIQLISYDKNSVEVTCAAIKSTGTPWEVSRSIVPDAINMPAHVESVQHNIDTVKVGGEFSLTCVSSGTNAVIQWLRNDKLLDNGIFHENLVVISGDFQYGQQKANQSTIKWNSTCADINKVDGSYRCRAVGIEETSSSEPVTTILNTCGGCCTPLEIFWIIFCCICVPGIVIGVICGVYYDPCKCCNCCACCASWKHTTKNAPDQTPTHNPYS